MSASFVSNGIIKSPNFTLWIQSGISNTLIVTIISEERKAGPFESCERCWLPVLSECRQLSTTLMWQDDFKGWERIRNSELKLQPSGSRQVKCWDIFVGGRRVHEI